VIGYNPLSLVNIDADKKNARDVCFVSARPHTCSEMRYDEMNAEISIRFTFILFYGRCAFSALTLLVGRQEGHPA